MRRVELGQVSRWVWAAIALAVAWFVVQQWGTESITLASIYGAFAGATPALFAAALMYVAPRERLVRIAALAFATPVAVTTFVDFGIALATTNLASDYAYLGPRLLGAVDGFNQIGWIFPIVAVFAMAFYIGPVYGRIGWLIVAIGVLIAIAQAANSSISAISADVPIGRIVIGIVATLIWVAWAFLVAVTVIRRMFILAVAAASHIVGGALSLVAFPALQGELTANPSGQVAQGLLATLWILGVIAWGAMIVGILRELPRSRSESATVPRDASQEALSAGR